VPEERGRVLISGTRKLGYTLKRHLRRRSAVEPEIGHMKADGLLGRNFLKGMQGNAINAILCGVGHNMRKILARLRFFAGPSNREMRPSLGFSGPVPC
jgi:IS5 family transposase